MQPAAGAGILGTMDDRRRFAPATARNREPILEVLRAHLKLGANVLEIASGTGEHAIFLAPRLGVASWQPTDPDADARASIDAWRAHEGASVIRPALALDVTAQWPTLAPAPDVVVCINMIHISPWRATLALFDGAATLLAGGSVLFLYGPYKRGGMHTAPSNEAFDTSLRARDPEWGVRDLDEVTAAAEERGFERTAVVEMPANNLSVLFRRR